MKRYAPVILKAFISFAISSSLAWIFAFPYFSAGSYTRLDEFALIAIPAFSLTYLIYNILSYFEENLNPDGLRDRINARLFSSWLLGGIASFFATAFLSNFYPAPYLFPLAVFLSLAFSIFFYDGLSKLTRFARNTPVNFGMTAFLFALIISFQAMFFYAGSQYPNLFHADFFLFSGNEIPVFAFANLVSFPLLAWTLQQLREFSARRRLAENQAVVFIRENVSGLSLSVLFFGLYLLIGSVLNHPNFDTDDVFFDADGFIWRFRLTTDHWQDFYWRSVHPLALLILRPLVKLVSIFLNGNLPFAAIALTAAAGAACVFLVWLLMKSALENELAALMMASLLGLSASHLFFGSLIETYIFLAALALLFFVLIQKRNVSVPLLIAAGVATMGITLTNFAQTIIALFGAKPDFKFVFKYGAAVLALVIALMLASNALYPNASPYFFVPSSFLAERQNVRAVSLNRAQALTRAFLFNNIAAPTPMTSYKDIPFTQFRFYRAEDYTISAYRSPLQFVVARLWLSFLALAAIFLFKEFKSRPLNLTLSLMGCVLFNVLIHLRYGKELFLYSPNWTYAIVLLLGISWKSLFKFRWFQFALAAFLFLLTLNNLALFRVIMEASAPYIK